jgi:hypothetical protein
LSWAREALGSGRYWVVDHARDRQRQRSVTAADMKHIVKNATDCRAYRDGVPRFGGTCWRVMGPSLDEIPTALGVEVHMDHLGKRVVILTVF